MAQSISPFFRSPFSDLTGGMLSHQMLGRCQKEEMRFMDCLENYGLDRGIKDKRCQDYLEDFRECHTLTKQLKRFEAMRKERGRQIASGKLQGDARYVSPKVDSY